MKTVREFVQSRNQQVDMPSVSLYNMIYDSTKENVTFYAALRMISSGSYKSNNDLRYQIKKIRLGKTKQDRNKLKSQLPAVTFSGTFGESRTAANFEKSSNLVVLDFDNIKFDKIQRVMLSMDPYVWAIFTSPSGNGLKVIARAKFGNKEQYTKAYKSLSEYFKGKFSMTADPACSDITRLCYLSFDEHFDLNLSGTAYFDYSTYTVDDITEVVACSDKDVSQDNVLHKEVESLVAKIEKLGVDITEDYHNWISIGFGLADSFGDMGRDFFHRISQFYPDYSDKETDKQYSHCLKSNGEGVTIRSLFYLAKAHDLIPETVIKEKSVSRNE